jgi:hypothetical protein
MSDSDLAKTGLVAFFNRFAKIDSTVKDWKRTRKIKDSRGDFVREFINAKAGITALVSGEALDEYTGADNDSLYCHEAGELYVAIHENIEGEEDEMGMGDERFSLMFVSKTQYEREGYFPDQHWGDVLEAAYKFPSGMLEDECMENTFIPSQPFQQMTKEELIAIIDAVPGVTYNPALDKEDGL